MIELKPIKESTEEYDAIEAKIKALFKREIYLPLLREFSINGKALRNSIEDLKKAIQSGRLTFNQGKFSGKLNATLSQELRSVGAKWNKISKCYSIRLEDLPLEVRLAISGSEYKFLDKIRQIDAKLSQVIPEELASRLKIENLFDRTLWKVESQFQKSVKNLTIAPKLTEDQAKRIASEWQTNMHYWIKNFTEEQIVKLRKDMQKSVYAGNRYGSAIKSIQDSYQVTANKAKFLARQETALLMTKHKEVRYQEAGVNEYKWRSVAGTPAHPVRPRHKALSDASQIHHEIFRFDDPPITSEPGTPERRNNPGADFNCRCTSVPVVRFKKVQSELP